ncbi:hypothetical protein V6Z11_A09G105100 [Gossypium hirsutum]
MVDSSGSHVKSTGYGRGARRLGRTELLTWLLEAWRLSCTAPEGCWGCCGASQGY